MIGDKLKYHATYKQITNFVISQLDDKLNAKHRICIAVGGESGCGKTSLAYALLKDIEAVTKLKGFIFHADDYFMLPPKDNHNHRLEDISNVGTHEVKLKLLDSQIHEFKKGKENLIKPLVIYDENVILEEQISCLDYDYCLVEGTYAMLLEEVNYKIFMETTYHDTRHSRIERARDVIDDFAEKVLEIEHQIVKKHKDLASIIIDKHFKLTNQN